MSIEIIDSIKAKNNGNFPVADSNDLLGGYHQLNTIAERDAIPNERRIEGMLCYVAENDQTYRLKNINNSLVWEPYSSDVIYKGIEAPTNTDMVWIDTDDENIDAILAESEILSTFQTALEDMRKKVEKVDYAITYQLDAGYFGEIESTPDNGENPNPPPDGLGLNSNGTVNAIQIKRGYEADLLKPDRESFLECEMLYVLDTNKLYIQTPMGLQLINGGGSDSGNLTGEYVELKSDSTVKYRLRVNNDGEIYVYNSIADTIKDPPITEPGRFAGLIINHIYGGGQAGSNKTLVSHSFIELYNTTKNEINLKGLSIQYKEYLGKWNVLPLRGIVKPYHSFLIRCAQHSEISRTSVRLKIKDYDMHWDIPLTEYGMSVYLCVGTEACTHNNPANTDGSNTKATGYIDLVGVGAAGGSSSVEAYESYFGNIMNKDTSAHRVDFKDTGNNFLDVLAIDWKTANPDIYRPRCLKDGEWDVHYDKLKLDPIAPNLINICYGKDGNTSRTFTWQSKINARGFLQYKKVGTTKWTTAETTTKVISHPDTLATVNSVIIHGLTPGIYIYRAGAEGRWSDEYQFEVKAPTNSDAISFLQVGDQQGINEYEYNVWKTCNDYICANEQFDFIINVGDISQNGGSRAYEWRYYYDKAKENIYSKCHMTTVGNNDLTMDDNNKKTDATAFTYYTTQENSTYISCYSWNYGYIHFISLNSNTLNENSEIATQQVAWIKEDMAKEENKKRWTIVYMHEAPYTHTKSTLLRCFIDVFAEVGVDLVLCGHHHRYSRSKRMGKQGANFANVESPTGFYCVMSQACGYKLAGLTNIASNYKEWNAFYKDEKNHPGYIMWNVTYNQIAMHVYEIRDVMPPEQNIGKSPYKVEYDTGFVITK